MRRTGIGTTADGYGVGSWQVVPVWVSVRLLLSLSTTTLSVEREERQRAAGGLPALLRVEPLDHGGARPAQHVALVGGEIGEAGAVAPPRAAARPRLQREAHAVEALEARQPAARLVEVELEPLAAQVALLADHAGGAGVAGAPLGVVVDQLVGRGDGVAGDDAAACSVAAGAVACGGGPRAAAARRGRGRRGRRRGAAAAPGRRSDARSGRPSPARPASDGVGPGGAGGAGFAAGSGLGRRASDFELLLASTRMTERTVSLAVRLPVASSSVIVLARIDVAPCHSWASPLYSAWPVCWL